MKKSGVFDEFEKEREFRKQGFGRIPCKSRDSEKDKRVQNVPTSGLGWRYENPNVAVCGFCGGWKPHSFFQFVEWRAGRFWRFFGGLCDFLWNLVNLRKNMH